jgi:tetratricopeptide (TPR) repeat protein
MKEYKLLFILLVLIDLMACNNDDGKNKETKTATAASSQTTSAVTDNLETLLKKYPDSAGLRMQLAQAFDSLGQDDKALAQMDILLRKDTSNYGLWYAEGQFFQNAKDTLHAIESYSRAAKIYAAPDALLSIANLLAEQKNPRCLDICSRVQGMGQGKEYDAHCYFIAGVYNARTLHRDKAIELFDKCIANDFTYMEAYVEKGLVYFDEKNYRAALEVFRFASTVNNLFADSYFWMARCYEMMNVKDSAALRFKQAYSLDKTMTEATEGLKRVGE